MAEYSKKQKAYMAMVAENSPIDADISMGWPDDARDLGWDDYCQWAHNLIDDLEEGADIGGFIGFEEWKEWRKEEAGDETVDFSTEECDLCDALPGRRHNATALLRGTERVGHGMECILLTVCDNCAHYIANSEVPDDECL